MHPGALEPPGQAKEPWVVFHAQRDRIPDLDPACAKQLGDLIGAGVKLGKGYHLAAASHDDGGPLGLGLGVN